MTFSPRKKTSKSKTRIRTTAWIKRTAKKLENRMKLQYNEAGEAIGLSHMASPITGQYKGKQVLKPKKDKKPSVIRA